MTAQEFLDGMEMTADELLQAMDDIQAAIEAVQSALEEAGRVARASLGAQAQVADSVAQTWATVSTSVGTSVSTVGNALTALADNMSKSTTGAAGLLAGIGSWLGPLGAGLALGGGALSLIGTIADAVDKHEQQETAARQERIASLNAETDAISDQITEYEKLVSTATPTASQKQRLLELENQLGTSLGVTTQQMRDQAEAGGLLAESFQKLNSAQYQTQYDDQIEEFQKNAKPNMQAFWDLRGQRHQEIESDLGMADAQLQWANAIDDGDSDAKAAIHQKIAEIRRQAMEQLVDEMPGLVAATLGPTLDEGIEAVITGMRARGAKISEASEQIVGDAIRQMAMYDPEQMIAGITDGTLGPKMDALIGSLEQDVNQFKQKKITIFGENGVLDTGEYAKFQQAGSEVLQKVSAQATALAQTLQLGDAARKSLIASMTQGALNMMGYGHAAKDTTSEIYDLVEAERQLQQEKYAQQQAEANAREDSKFSNITDVKSVRGEFTEKNDKYREAIEKQQLLNQLMRDEAKTQEEINSIVDKLGGKYNAVMSMGEDGNLFLDKDKVQTQLAAATGEVDRLGEGLQRVRTLIQNGIAGLSEADAEEYGGLIDELNGILASGQSSEQIEAVAEQNAAFYVEAFNKKVRDTPIDAINADGSNLEQVYDQTNLYTSEQAGGANEYLSAQGMEEFQITADLSDAPALIEQTATALALLNLQIATYGEQQLPEDLLRAQQMLTDVLSVTGAYDALGDGAQHSAQAVQDAAHAMSGTQQVAGQYARELNDLSRQVTTLGNNKKLNASLSEQAKNLKASGKSMDSASPALKAWAKANGLAGKSVDDVVSALDEEKKGLDGATNKVQASLQTQLDYWMGVRNGILALPIEAQMTAENTVLMAAANQCITALQALLDEMNKGEGITATQHGGGGKSKKKQAEEEAERAAAEAARAAEEAWRKQLESEIKAIERKREENEITTKQEIAEYEQLYEKYKGYAELKEQLEERIYEARRKLRQEEIAELDKLNDGILDALRARYEEQQRIEDERLQASIDGWQEWADENVKAIQAQIDALDELTRTEDREAQDAEKRRKIAATEQMIAYTTDDANRERLEKELEKLQEEYAKWQRSNAINDEKERLRLEQEAIQQRAQDEQEALEKQRTELEKVYEERLKDAALRAEAERMMTQHSQEDILGLINQYAPDYEAVGTTLGERLFNGLTGALGSLTDWFAGLNAQILAVQERAAQSALAAADAFRASGAGTANVSTAPQVVSVEQNNNFYTPVESPSDTARKVQGVNEALAEQLVYGQ